MHSVKNLSTLFSLCMKVCHDWIYEEKYINQFFQVSKWFRIQSVFEMAYLNVNGDISEARRNPTIVSRNKELVVSIVSLESLLQCHFSCLTVHLEKFTMATFHLIPAIFREWNCKIIPLLLSTHIPLNL